MLFKIKAFTLWVQTFVGTVEASSWNVFELLKREEKKRGGGGGMETEVTITKDELG